jgi:hypothetical protein
MRFDNRLAMKEIVEDAYIVGATLATTLAWNGLEEIVHKASHQLQFNVQGVDAMGPVLSIGAFVALTLLGVSRSLVGKGVEVDAVRPGGAGVVFPKPNAPRFTIS